MTSLACFVDLSSVLQKSKNVSTVVNNLAFWLRLIYESAKWMFTYFDERGEAMFCENTQACEKESKQDWF